jgi:hypothetical protein
VITISAGAGLSGVTERHICDGSRARGTDGLLIKPTGDQAGARAAGPGQMKGTHFRGQIRSEPPDTTGPRSTDSRDSSGSRYSCGVSFCAPAVS